jgi:hypothetical protein
MPSLPGAGCDEKVAVELFRRDRAVEGGNQLAEHGGQLLWHRVSDLGRAAECYSGAASKPIPAASKRAFGWSPSALV